MALSEVRSFTEPGDFESAIHGVEVELCLLAPGPFHATITRVELHSLKMHRFSESHPRIMHAAVHNDRAIFSFHTEPGPDMFRGGIKMGPDSIARLARRQSYFQRSTGPVAWGCMSLPAEEMRSAGIKAAGCDLMPPSSEIVATPVPGAMAKLQRLHAAAGLLAERAPEVIHQPEAARGLEQALVESLTACFSTDDGIEDRSSQRRHGMIMRRFNAVLRADADRPLYVLEMAEAIGVSVSSLSACCQEHLGMGPKKYLLLRRMHLARQALYRADSNAVSVTDVATQYGFWQLGRFAGEYRYLFGESPSATLRKEPA